MTRIELKAWIETFVNKDGKISPWIGRPDWLIKKGFIDQHKSIIDCTSFMPEETTKLIERIVLIRQDITSQPLCKKCPNPTQYFAKYNGFAEYCGLKCSASSIETRNKVKATNQIKFGADYNFKTEAFKTASSKTIKEKYGVSNVMHNLEIRKRQKKTVIKKYGVDKAITQQKLNNKPDNYIASFECFGAKLELEYYKLHDYSFTSKETSDQIFYHQKKALLAQKKNTKLLQIFENEWENPITQDVWKSIISNRFGKNTKIFGRQCKIVDVTSFDKRKFLNEHHLQGDAQSSINLGLTYNDELVSLMTFGKSRFNKNFDFEMTRFVTAKYKTVIGGASKLFNHFVKSHVGTSIISYADLRFSSGDLYKKLNFEYLRTTHPNYFYYLPNENILHSRQAFQKHKLKKKLKIFDASKTESENVFANGYRRIWDAGNLVFGFKS